MIQMHDARLAADLAIFNERLVLAAPFVDGYGAQLAAKWAGDFNLGAEEPLISPFHAQKPLFLPRPYPSAAPAFCGAASWMRPGVESFSFQRKLDSIMKR
jgi:hypothetical protein